MSNQQAGHVSVRESQYGRMVNEWCLMKEEAALVSQVRFQLCLCVRFMSLRSQMCHVTGYKRLYEHMLVFNGTG